MSVSAKKSPFACNIKISHALAAAVFLPLLTALVLAGILVVERSRVASEMSEIKRLSDSLTLLSGLVHELQKERGATAVFLSSEGEKFGPELRAQRESADSAQAAVDAYFASHDFSNADGGWQARLAEIQAGLAGRAGVRARVDALAISAPEALAYYTETNLKVLALIKYTASLSHDVEVANATIAFSYFLMGKERVGIERAIGASGFALGRFSPSQLQKFNELIALQEVYFTEFENLATPAQADILPAILRAPAAQSVQTMRDLANAGGDLSAYSGNDFFSAQTRKLELLKEAENRLAGDLRALTSAKEASALTQRNLLLAAMAVVLALITGFSFLMMRSVSRSVGGVVRTAEKLADGKLDTPFPPISGNEIGRITAALVKFRDSIVESQRQAALARQKEEEFRAAQERQREEAQAAEMARKEAALAEEKARLEAQEKAEAEKRAAEKALEEEHRKALDKIREKEQQAAAEIAEVVQACGAGDFAQRTRTDDKEGVFAEICKGVNRIGEFTQKNLEQVQAALSALKNGDISYRMQGRYNGAFATIQQDMNAAFDALSEIIQQIDSSAESVRASTREIAETSTSLAKRTEAAAANLEETASAVGGLSEAVHRTSELAVSTNESIRGIEGQTKKSTAIVEETIAAITGIKQASATISNTISVIDEIAFQTNLLALNAGVEAARAGEAGRGFAVVASEIRDLAAKSSDAAHEISALMENNEAKVAEGVKLVDQTGKALTRIDADISEISRSVSEIADFAVQQTKAIDEIRVATTQLDKVTQENAAMFEETTALNVSLKGETEVLRDILAKFRIDGSAGNGAKKVVPMARPAPKGRPHTPAPRATTTPAPATATAQDWQDF